LNNSHNRIGYLFKTGRTQRINSNSPNDFFYGADYLRSKGLDINIIDVNMLGISGKMGVLTTLITLPFYKLTGLHLAIIYRFLRILRKAGINNYEVLITTTTALGIAMSFLKKIGFIRSKIIFIIMGLGDFMKSPVRSYFLRKILSDVSLLSISKGEINHIFKNTKNNIM